MSEKSEDILTQLDWWLKHFSAPEEWHEVCQRARDEIAALRNEAEEYQRAWLAAQSMLNLALKERDALHNVAQRKLEDWRIGVAPVVRAQGLRDAAQRCRSMADNYEGADYETCRMCAAAILALIEKSGIDKSVSDLDQGESDAV